MDKSVSVAPDMSVLSLDPNDMRSCPTLYDSLAERTATSLAYDIARKTDQSISDVPLLTATTPSPSSALVMGSDPHGTTMIIGMVRINYFVVIAMIHINILILGAPD